MQKVPKGIDKHRFLKPLATFNKQTTDCQHINHKRVCRSAKILFFQVV
jgi:hypothetical protein